MTSEQQLKWGEPSGGMYGGIVHGRCQRNPLFPVGLVLVYIMSELVSKHTMAPLNTPLRFGMKRSGLSFLNLMHLAGISEHLTNEVSALISL